MMSGEDVDRAEVFGERQEASERIAPGFAPQREVAEHVARYEWAARRIPRGRVLDVACGVGYGAPLLRKAGVGEVASVDIALPALEFGIGRYGLAATCADATRLPFRDGTFDSIVSLETIEHLVDPDALLAECARVLRADGTLIVSCPNIELSKRNNPYHFSEMTWAELTGRLRRASFEIAEWGGQHWNVLSGVLWRVRGVARLARFIDRSPRVGLVRVPRSAPKVFCVRAVRRS